jgi:hypothetical protein
MNSLRMQLTQGGVALVALVAIGCTSSPMAVETHRGAIREPDGSYNFYAGRGIGDILARGGVVSDDHPTPFTRLRVSSAFVDAALATPKRVKTVSFEVPDPSVEVTVRKFVAGTYTLETLHFRPGEPWISGIAQVAADGETFTAGFFRVVKWVGNIPGMPKALAQQIYTTGFVPDDNIPALRYAEVPFQGDLPESWK